MHFREFRQAGHPRSLVAGLLHFDVSFMAWVMLGALGAYISADLGLSPAQKGLMVALPPLGGAGFRLLIGGVAERFGIKRTGLVTLALTLVPLAWASLAGGTYPQVLGIGILLGIAGASFAVALPLVGYWYPPEYRGLALGIAGAGNSGTIVAALAAPRIAEHVGWHATFALAAVPVSLVWVAFALLAKEPPRPAGTVPPAMSASLRLLADPDARKLAAFYSVTFGGFVGMASYLPIFFVDQFGLAKVSAAGYAALCAVAGSFLRPFGGALSDRFGGTRVLITALGGVGMIGVGLATLPGLGVTVLLLFCALGALGMGNGAVFGLVPELFPTRIGSITGLVGAAGGVGGFLLPFALGSLAGVMGSYTPGFACIAAATAGAAMCAVRVERSWRRPSEPAAELALS